jgi:hypothetical protein
VFHVFDSFLEFQMKEALFLPILLMTVESMTPQVSV